MKTWIIHCFVLLLRCRLIVGGQEVVCYERDIKSVWGVIVNKSRPVEDRVHIIDQDYRMLRLYASGDSLRADPPVDRRTWIPDFIRSTRAGLWHVSDDERKITSGVEYGQQNRLNTKWKFYAKVDDVEEKEDFGKEGRAKDLLWSTVVFFPPSRIVHHHIILKKDCRVFLHKVTRSITKDGSLSPRQVEEEKVGFMEAKKYINNLDLRPHYIIPIDGSFERVVVLFKNAKYAIRKGDQAIYMRDLASLRLQAVRPEIIRIKAVSYRNGDNPWILWDQDNRPLRLRFPENNNDDTIGAHYVDLGSERADSLLFMNSSIRNGDAVTVFALEEQSIYFSLEKAPEIWRVNAPFHVCKWTKVNKVSSEEKFIEPDDGKGIVMWAWYEVNSTKENPLEKMLYQIFDENKSPSQWKHRVCYEKISDECHQFGCSGPWPRRECGTGDPARMDDRYEKPAFPQYRIILEGKIFHIHRTPYKHGNGSKFEKVSSDKEEPFRRARYMSPIVGKYCVSETEVEVDPTGPTIGPGDHGANCFYGSSRVRTTTTTAPTTSATVNAASSSTELSTSESGLTTSTTTRKTRKTTTPTKFTTEDDFGCLTVSPVNPFIGFALLLIQQLIQRLM